MNVKENTAQIHLWEGTYSVTGHSALISGDASTCQLVLSFARKFSIQSDKGKLKTAKEVLKSDVICIKEGGFENALVVRNENEFRRSIHA